MGRGWGDRKGGGCGYIWTNLSWDRLKLVKLAFRDVDPEDTDSRALETGFHAADKARREWGRFQYAQLMR